LANLQLLSSQPSKVFEKLVRIHLDVCYKQKSTLLGNAIKTLPRC